MNARGTKSVEGLPKPGEGKSKSLARKIKARGSEFQVSFFRESGLFKGLRANPNREIASRFSLRLAPWRRALAHVDVRRCAAATPREKDGAAPALQEPSRNPCRLAFGRARSLFGEPRATIAQILKIGNKIAWNRALVGDNARIIKTKYPRRAPSLALAHFRFRASFHRCCEREPT